MTDQAPIDLYYWPTPNGWKITIMLEELGVPYKVNLVDIGKGDQFKPEFLAIAPNNRMPAIVDPNGPDGKPISIFESGAILKYLGQKYGKFYPTDIRKQVDVDQWLFWQMGGFGPMLGQNHHFALYAPEKIDYAIRRYRDESARLYRVLNQQLEGKDYICGEYSIADMACVGWAKGHEKQGVPATDIPNVMKWFERMTARPAVQRGLNVNAADVAQRNIATDKEAQSVLFNQR